MTGPLTGSIALPTALQASSRWTAERVRNLRHLLDRQAAALGALSCVAAAGSLGRGEAGPASDVDCVVVAADEAAADAIEAAMAIVLETIARADLRAPKAAGFFRRPVSRSQLLDPKRLGRIDEEPQVYGKRLQCLLDTTPLIGDEPFVKLRHDVLHWFTDWQPVATPFALLASELVRYRHSYVAYQTFDFAHGRGDSWRLRMVKLGSSRLVTVAGLLALIGESTREHDPIDFVEVNLALTPLQRLLRVIERRDPARAARVAHYYGVAHEWVECPNRRRRLLEQGPSVELQALAQGRQGNLLGQEIEEPLTALGNEINDFFLAQREHWARWFYRALLL